MDSLERDLKRAMEPVEPPAGFADRVLTRIRDQQVRAQRRVPARDASGGWWTWLFAPAWRPALAAALSLFLVVAAGISYQRRQQEKRAEKAAAELMVALEITSEKLQRVRTVLVEPKNSHEVRP